MPDDIDEDVLDFDDEEEDDDLEYCEGCGRPFGEGQCPFCCGHDFAPGSEECDFCNHVKECRTISREGD
jgi:hypothetical protein